MAQRGFPLTHEILKDKVDSIICPRLGNQFPEEGVGKQWTLRFIEKYQNELKMFWSSSLDEKHSHAVNPTTNQQWFDLLKEVLAGKRDYEFNINSDKNSNSASPTTLILPENVYGADESGFMLSQSTKQHVIGSRSKKMQHQQGDGGQENTTVIITICADGTTTRPTIIFKGHTYQVKWNQDNLTKALLAHSPKGWIDGELRLEWLKDFHEQTKEKANGCTQVLLVDGHNSHYTSAFLHFARAHHIHILCYPAHGTHVYQGLDVKDNFMAIYGAAHKKTLTPENIHAAFKKTSVWPFNCSVVTPSMMATSKETSLKTYLPIPQPSPVVAISRLIHTVTVNTCK
ncbi:hypothetical protein GYMLUDRAFT_78436 [Collybiopsis luxurians FD-317 M1]|uniref:DDE-1 domain-containing protein n=1 Tax=Collybiopsis luxurians FD-317 M1 TaxID=944289 RepID=A0A0D0AKD8_9AGAR|nr:hypothetical protein GYMLUDRAFT_78436 [Collybiopsis luxurians FD-317 M1]